MSYTNATFFLDYNLGSDAARTTLASVIFSNPSADVVLGTKATHGLVTGACITVSGCTQAYANAVWKITRVDADTFTVDGASWASWNGADVTGDVVPFGGQSWADAWKTINLGSTAARIAPGDTVKIAKSPAPTSIGDGTWTTNTKTGGGFPTALTITGAADNGAGLVRLTMADTSTLTTNDVVQVLGIVGTVEANGSWLCTVIDATHIDLQGSAFVNAWSSGGTCQQINSKAVVLASAQTANVHNCDTIWTVAGSSTITLTAYTTDAKEGQSCVKVAKTSPSNNTLYAYKALTSTNYSSYQKISFWIKNSTAITANQWKLCLCSDNAGVTIVDTFDIPAIASTARWLPLTITKTGGGNLGASIQSVALYSSSSAGTTAGIFLDNIIACTTSGLNLQSLISLNTLEQSTVADANYGNEGWYGIQSIAPLGKIVLLDNDTNTICNAGRGYSGTSVTDTTYIRETIKTALATSTGASVQPVLDSGTLGSDIEFQGGYDTGTGNQTGETFFDGLNGYGYGVDNTGMSYITINHLSFTRYYRGLVPAGLTTLGTISDLNNNTNYALSFAGSKISIGNLININNNSTGGIYSTMALTIIDRIVNANNNLDVGIYWAAAVNNSIFVIDNANNNTNYGIRASSNACGNYYGTISSCSYNGSTGFYANSMGNQGWNNSINAITTTGNTTSAIFYPMGTLYINNGYFSETTVVTGMVAAGNVKIFSSNQGAADTHYFYTDDAYAVTAASTDGTSWNIYPTATTRSTRYPVSLAIANIHCIANRQVHLHATVQKSHTTDIAGRIICEGGQVTGVASDVIATKADDTDEEVLSIKFTPTANGVVDINFEGWWVANAADEHVTLRTITTNARKYSKVFLEDTQTTQAFDYVLKYSAETANPYITETTAATVGAYTEFTIDHSTQTCTITADTTMEKLYDYSQWDLTQDANLVYPEWFETIDGVNFTSTYNIVLNTGVDLTGGGTIDVGAGTFTKTGTATYDGIIIGSTERQVHLTLAGLVAGSTVQVYDNDNTTELYNAVVAGTSLDYIFTHTVDTEVRIRVRKAGYIPYEYTGDILETGLALNVSQDADDVYTANAIDGSTVTEFALSGATIKIYIDDPNNATTAQRMYNWYMYIIATTTYIGIQPNDITAQTAWSYVLADEILLYNQDAANPCFIEGANINNVTSDGQVIDTAGGMININGYFPFNSAADVGTAVKDAGVLTTAKFLGLK